MVVLAQIAALEERVDGFLAAIQREEEFDEACSDESDDDTIINGSCILKRFLGPNVDIICSPQVFALWSRGTLLKEFLQVYELASHVAAATNGVH
eukprot:COSAG05_NODE_362_length_10792_cov_14.566913_7_plen_95_part_00